MKTPSQPSEINRRTDLLGHLSCMEWDPASVGATRIPIRIAGIRVDLLTHSEALAKRVRDYFSAYLGIGQAAGEILAEEIQSSTLWEDTDPEFDIRAEEVVQRDFAAKMLNTSEPERALALLAPGLDDSFHNLLRWFMPRLLLREGAFLLHGAGAIRDGKGYVFFGHSEAGKSTSVSLIEDADPHATILGDDGIIIQMRDQEAYVVSAPLGCGYSRFAPAPASAPLRGLFTLEQSAAHRISSLSLSEGVLQLLASVMNVGFDEEIEAKMNLALRFAQAPCKIQRLHFKKDAGFWPLVRLGKTTRHETREEEIAHV